MKTFEFSLDKKIYLPNYISRGETICFLDIETDGLSHSRNRVVLIGIFIIDTESSNQKLFQILSEKPSDEPMILEKMNDLISGVDTVFTYNGASFDFPFLKQRLHKHSIADNLGFLSHIDLMRRVKKHKASLSLENCKLKTVEKKVGVVRKDTIDGRESVLLYNEYLKTGNPAIEKTILRHNYEDIYYLPDILKIEDIISNSNVINVDVCGKKVKLELLSEKIRMSKSLLKVSGISPTLQIPEYILFEDIFNLHWNTREGVFTMEIFVDSDLLPDGRILSYIDISDFELPGLKVPLKLNINANFIPVSVDKDLAFQNVIAFIDSVLKRL